MVIKMLRFSDFDTCTYFKPLLSPFLCETTCEPSTQMPDDEVEKWIEMKLRVFDGGSNFEVNTLAFVNEPVESERTMIEDFPWISLEDLQDSFGIYKDNLSNFSLGFNQASAERRDLVPERWRSWSFQVVPGTSTTKNQIWNRATRNK